VPAFGPISRANLIRALRRAGFDGPTPGQKHAHMTRDGRRIRVPNPHRGDISVDLLAEILRLAEISRDEWEQL
jgi:predicted RNA binding protein YcfA (HicA-like mRNA interferase family)